MFLKSKNNAESSYTSKSKLKMKINIKPLWITQKNLFTVLKFEGQCQLQIIAYFSFC